MTATFFLMSNGERSLITDEPDLAEVLHRDGPFEVRSDIQAESWLDAKVGFGFEPTALQAAMLAVPPAQRQGVQWRWLP